MERQEQQYGSTQPRPPIAKRSKPQGRKPKVSVKPGRRAWIGSLAILSGVWVVLVVVTLSAVSGLLSPDSSNGRRATGAAIVRETAETAQAAKRQSRLPLWLFGAIALSCAAGSMLVSKQVNRPPRPLKSTKLKRITPYTASDALNVPLPLPEPQPYPTIAPSFALVPHRTQPSPAAPFVPPTTLMQLAQQSAQQAAGKTDVPVTIVPSEESHPLDWGEASLADKLDLRKQRSVSSLL